MKGRAARTFVNYFIDEIANMSFFDGSWPRRGDFCIFAVRHPLKFTALAKVFQKRSHRRTRHIFEIELGGMDFIHDAFLQPRIFQHLAINEAFVIAHAFKRSRRNERRIEWLDRVRNQAALFARGLGFGFRYTFSATSAATAATTGAGFFGFFFRGFSNCFRLQVQIRFSFSFSFAQRINAFMRCFDVMLAFDARLRDLFGGSFLGSRSVALLCAVNDDAFELGFFIKEI